MAEHSLDVDFSEVTVHEPQSLQRGKRHRKRRAGKAALGDTNGPPSAATSGSSEDERAGHIAQGPPTEQDCCQFFNLATRERQLDVANAPQAATEVSVLETKFEEIADKLEAKFDYYFAKIEGITNDRVRGLLAGERSEVLRDGVPPHARNLHGETEGVGRSGTTSQDDPECQPLVQLATVQHSLRVQSSDESMFEGRRDTSAWFNQKSLEWQQTLQHWRQL